MFQAIKLIFAADRIFDLIARGMDDEARGLIDKLNYTEENLSKIPHGVEIIIIKKFLDREKYIKVSDEWIKSIIKLITETRYYNIDEKEYLKIYAIRLFELDGGKIDNDLTLRPFNIAKVRSGLQRKFPVARSSY